MVEHQDIWFSQGEIHFLMLLRRIKRGYWMTIEPAGAQRGYSCFLDCLSSLRVAG